MITEGDNGKVVQRAVMPGYNYHYKTHRIDSVVAGAAFTQCGVRMEPTNKEGAALTLFPEDAKITCGRGCK